MKSETTKVTGLIRLCRLNNPYKFSSWLTITFEDVGVNDKMSDAAIQCHVNSFYYGWQIVSVESACGHVRFFG